MVTQAAASGPDRRAAGGGFVFSFLTCLAGSVILLWIKNMLTGRRSVG